MSSSNNPQQPYLSVQETSQSSSAPPSPSTAPTPISASATPPAILVHPVLQAQTDSFNESLANPSSNPEMSNYSSSPSDYSYPSSTGGAPGGGSGIVSQVMS